MKKYSTMHGDSSVTASAHKIMRRGSLRCIYECRARFGCTVLKCLSGLAYLVFVFASVGVASATLVYAVPGESRKAPTQQELATLRKEAMALFADRPQSQALPEPRQQRRTHERDLVAGWRQALSRGRFNDNRNVFEQQQGYAHNDRKMMFRSPRRPMVILPPDVDIDVALLTLHNNPSFEGATVVLLEMPFLRTLPALQRAYGPLDIRVVENSAIKRELDWVNLPVLVTETGQITKFHF